MTLSRSLQGKINRQSGQVAESAVKVALTRLGLHCIERRETGWKVIYGEPDPKRGGRRSIKHAFPMAKVSGDFTAVAPGGIYCHVEAKHHSDPDARLSLSDFQKDGAGDMNQLQALGRYAMLGCLSLVAWSTPRGLLILVWPIPGLAFKKPISFDTARQFHITQLPQRNSHVR